MVAISDEMKVFVGTTRVFRQFNSTLNNKLQRNKNKAAYLQSPELFALAMAVKNYQLSSCFRFVKDPKTGIRLTCIIKFLNPVTKDKVMTFLDTRASEIERLSEEAGKAIPEYQMFFRETAKRARRICSEYANSTNK